MAAGRPMPLCDAHGHPPPRHTAPPSRRPAAEDQPGVLERDGCWTKVGGGAGGTGPQPAPGLCGSGRAAWGPSPVRPLEQPAGGWASPAWGSAPRAWDTPTAPSECGARPGRVPLWGHGLGTSWVPWGVGQGQEIQRTGNTPRLSAGLEPHVVTIKHAPAGRGITAAQGISPQRPSEPGDLGLERGQDERRSAQPGTEPAHPDPAARGSRGRADPGRGAGTFLCMHVLSSI